MLSGCKYSIAGLCLWLALLAQPALALDLNVVHSGTWPPYSDQELPGQGLAIDLVTTALQRAGYNVRLRTDSLDRILEGGKLGIYDVFATPWYSGERNQFLEFSEPYLESSIRFVKKKDDKFEYEKFTDLEGKRVGVVTDYAYEESFNASRHIIKVKERNLIQNLLKLTQGRIDLALDDELVLRYELNRFMPNSMASLEFLDKPLAVRGIHIGVSRENPQHRKIVDDFNKTIAAMKQDGSYDSIVQKHMAYINAPAQ